MPINDPPIPEYSGPPQYQPNQPPETYPPTYQQSYPVPQQHQPQQVVYVQGNQRETSSLATMSIIFAILGVIGGCCTFGVFSIVAVTLAHFAWKETKSGEKGGHGMTVTGLVLGYLMLIPAIFLSVSFVLQGTFGGVS